ncbi:ribonuclease HII [Caminicella sporogenes]|uniref:ribonuclease HII n=1 Tax=Caminicella sporogenes TaxID=166485 RepID=UPI0025407F2D|nr:ribonuclease HII [Caminicella sporogenes]WIF94622.1 ribonuclease HII [Caminicella sporogenes]
MDLKNMSAHEVRNFLQKLSIEEKLKYVTILKDDNRKTIKKFADKIEREYSKFIGERERILKMCKIENELYNQNYNLIAGIDEAGRGPLAGPVVAAAVILPKDKLIFGINDSKKIPEKKRYKLYDIINEVAIDVGIGIVDNEIIDKINIFNATKLAMKKAVLSLKNKPDFLLIDALKLTDINIKQKEIVKGDSLSISIAAASIVAKVTRDRIVIEYEKKYPGYGFKNHKGYGTKEHYKAIKEFGITPFHRKTFLKSLGD